MASLMAIAMAIALWQNALLTPLAKWPKPLHSTKNYGSLTLSLKTEPRARSRERE